MPRTRCRFPNITKLVSLRLSRRECVFKTSSRFHRVRHENIHIFKKNLDQNGLLWKKLEHFEIGRPKFSRSKNLENVQRTFHWKLYENEKKWDRKKSKIFDLKIFHFSYNFQWKKSKFFDLEIFQKYSSQKISDELFALTFFVFNIFWWFFL